MFPLNPKKFLYIIGLPCFLVVAEGEKILISRTRLAPDYSLKDVDGDNIPGEAGVDYPVYSSVPTGTSFRCKDHDYAGYFGDVEAGCQAYHVCFPDGRNASFLCVNGTVFHQRYYVCDWWFHFDCDNSPELYELNLFRKIPLPVLPPVQRRPFVTPIPEPGVVGPRNSPPLGPGPRSSPPAGPGSRISPPTGPGSRNSPVPGPGSRSNPPPGVIDSRGNPPSRTGGPRTNILPREDDRVTNPNRNRNRIPDDRDEPRLIPGKPPGQEKNVRTPIDKIIPKRKGDDCECFCDDGKTQRSKYSTYKNQ